MGTFRRLVIGVAEVIQVVSIFVMTFMGGMLGWWVVEMSYLRPFTQQQIQMGDVVVAPLVPVLGFVAGAIIGFGLAATAAAILFALAEIVRNTRQIPIQYSDVDAGGILVERGEPRF